MRASRAKGYLGYRADKIEADGLTWKRITVQFVLANWGNFHCLLLAFSSRRFKLIAFLPTDQAR